MKTNDAFYNILLSEFLRPRRLFINKRGAVVIIPLIIDDRTITSIDI